MKTLRESVQEYDSLRTKRLELEKQIDEIKTHEEELRKEIVADMVAQGLTTTKFDDGLRVTVRNVNTYCVQDIEKVLLWQIKELVKCHKENRPLVDGLLFQQRLGQRTLDSGLGSDYSEEDMRAMGVLTKSRRDLSLTRVKQ